MIIETGRFGQLTISTEEVINFPKGILGFPEYARFCVVDPNDDTLILWLQSLDNARIAFPIIEPRILKNNFVVNLSGAEQRELKLADLKDASVYVILTIPGDVSQMTANLKAPIVINLRNQIARQVVLQENEYGIRANVFVDLKRHLMTIQASGASAAVSGKSARTAIRVSALSASTEIRSLEIN